MSKTVPRAKITIEGIAVGLPNGGKPALCGLRSTSGCQSGCYGLFLILMNEHFGWDTHALVDAADHVQGQGALVG